MRDILTGLAIVLIVVLTTLLVAPYFVDWNGQRGFLEAQLSRAFGQRVTIGGSIDLKLLPTPYIRLNQAVIGSDEGAVRIGIRHLDLELAVAPLLHGEFDIVEGRLDEPTIRLTLQPDRTLPPFPTTPALRADIRLERIAVRNGTLAVADPASGRTLVLDHLDFTADAPALVGPFKGSGTAGSGAGRTTFRFSTSEARKGRTHLHLAMGETATHPGLDLDGELALLASDGGVRQSFEGTAVVLGRLDDPEDASLPWRIGGPVHLDPGGATLTGGELRLGGENGLAFKADLSGTFGENAALTAHLGAQQLDIDQLSGPAADPAAPPPPPQLASPRRIRALVAAALPPVPTTLDVAVDAATWGGKALSDLALHLKPVAGGSTLQASGGGPGGLSLSLEGTVTEGETRFRGQGRLGADDLPQALGWLERVAPSLAPPAGTLPFSAAALSGALTFDSGALEAREAAVQLDRSQLQGSLRLAFGDSVHAPHLSADLRTGRLDLDGLPDVRAFGRAAKSLDLTLAVKADATRIANLGNGALDAGRVSLDVEGRGGRIDLRGLTIDKLGGAALAATGHLDENAATLDVRFDAERLDAAASLARQLAPGPWSEALATRAATLAPAHGRLEAALTAPKGDSVFIPSRLHFDGTLAGTEVAASLTPAPAAADGSVVAARARSADAAALLRQLGLDAGIAADPVGAGQVVLSATGDLRRPMSSRLEASFGPTRLTIDGRFDLFGKAEGGSGKVELRSADLGPGLRVLGLLPPDRGGSLAVDLAGAVAVGQNGVALSDLRGKLAGTTLTGTLKLGPSSDAEPMLGGTLDLDRLAIADVAGLVLGPTRRSAGGSPWSGEPFAAPAAGLPRATLALRVRTLDLGLGLSAADATLDLRSGPGLVGITQGEATMRGGRIQGGFTLRRDGRQATLEGTLAADRVSLDFPALRAGMTGKLDFAGGGATPLALVNSLAGSGTATLADAEVKGADPAALPQVFDAVEKDALAVDEETVTRALEEAAKAPLSAGTLRGTLGLAGGALTLAPSAGEADRGSGAVATTVDATLDLRALRLGVRASETLRKLPRDWSGPPPTVVVTQAGPLAAPRRSFDVSGFLNAVAARAIARESARIEAYEFDLRERALFNARLQSDRRREADRLKAEADARVAEAIKRAAAELARKTEADRRAKAEAARADRGRGAAETPPAGGEGAPPPERSPEAPRFAAPPPGKTADPSAAGRY